MDGVLLARIAAGLFGLVIILSVTKSYFVNRRNRHDYLQGLRKVILVSFAIFVSSLTVSILIILLEGSLWLVFGLGVVAAGSAIVGSIGLGWLIIKEHWL